MRKTSLPCGESNLYPSVGQLVALSLYRLSYPGVLTLTVRNGWKWSWGLSEVAGKSDVKGKTFSVRIILPLLWFWYVLCCSRFNFGVFNCFLAWERVRCVEVPFVTAGSGWRDLERVKHIDPRPCNLSCLMIMDEWFCMQICGLVSKCA